MGLVFLRSHHEHMKGPANGHCITPTAEARTGTSDIHRTNQAAKAGLHGLRQHLTAAVTR